MFSQYLLSFLIFSPLMGVLFLLTIGGKHIDVDRNSRHVALWMSFVTFFISLFVVFGFDMGSDDLYQMVEHIQLVSFNIGGAWPIHVDYHIGVDGMALGMILLTTFLTPLCILASFYSITHRVKEFMIAFLLMECFILVSFASINTIMFYVFFEAILIPMYIIIGVWGGENRIYAAYKFFLYTFVGSVLMLVALIYIARVTGMTDLSVLLMKISAGGVILSEHAQTYIFWAFFFAFAVKIPMWPFHTWLPDAHVQAPTSGSMMLAGVLLKLGGYGFIRFVLPLCPNACIDFQWVIYGLSIIAIIYTSLVALVQTDIKKLVAYSSVAHMGFVTIGIFSLNDYGVQGALIQMISHGVVSAGLFACIGVIYDRMHTREISFYGGLAAKMPAYAFVFVALIMGSVGLPGTSGFVGEFIVLLGLFMDSGVVAALAATGVVLGATYALYVTKNVLFGPLENEKLDAIQDLRWYEYGIFIPLLIVMIVIGVYPMWIIDLFDKTLTHLTPVFKPVMHLMGA